MNQNQINSIADQEFNLLTKNYMKDQNTFCKHLANAYRYNQGHYGNDWLRVNDRLQKDVDGPDYNSKLFQWIDKVSLN